MFKKSVHKRRVDPVTPLERCSISEEMVGYALEWLLSKGIISGFSHSSPGSGMDRQGKDFRIIVEGKKKTKIFFLQVKSSIKGAVKHREDVEKLQKEKRKDIFPISVIVVEKRDDMFRLAERIKDILEIS